MKEDCAFGAKPNPQQQINPERATVIRRNDILPTFQIAYMGLKDEPAGFWLGVGMIAEGPLTLIIWLAPEGSCNALFGNFVACPFPLWLICVIALVSYFFTAWACHRLGLGESGK